MATSELIDLLTKVQALLQELAPVGTTDYNQHKADQCYEYAAQLGGVIKELIE
jgi:hypothetical protein